MVDTEERHHQKRGGPHAHWTLPMTRPREEKTDIIGACSRHSIPTLPGTWGGVDTVNALASTAREREKGLKRNRKWKGKKKGLHDKR
jgi:hypothetical protein